MKNFSVDHLIVLRGLLREHRHWGPFKDQLKERLQDVQIHYIDLPGAGDNSKTTPPFSTFAMAEFIDQKVQEILQNDDQKRVGIFAVSLGGMVALEMMGQFGSRYQKALVMNTSSALSEKSKRLRSKVWTTFFTTLIDFNQVRREKKIIPMIVNSIEGREAAESLWVRISKDLKLHPLLPIAQFRAAAKFIPSENLVGSDKIQLISSLGDLLVDPSCSELLHKRYGWKLRIHPWGGHDLPWDDPQWLLSEIETFFA